MKKLSMLLGRVGGQKQSFLTAVLMSVVCLFFMSSVYADGAIAVEIEYSLDNGKTFKSAVEVPKGGSVLVRFSWDNTRADDSRNEYLCSINNPETDFASANVGKKNWGGVKKWIQKVPPGYISAKKSSITMKLDLGERKEGVVGFRNKWNKEKRQYIAAPLPACPALAPGTYIFNFQIYYLKTDRKTKVQGTKMFPITIK
jgi:hypothetical protein